MFAPTIATVVAVRMVEKRSWRSGVGLRFRGLWRRLARWSLLGFLIVLALGTITVVVALLRGVPGDLTGRTWLHQTTEQLAQAGLSLPPAGIIGLTAIGGVVGIVITAVATLGEEIGWRGFLWPRLKPLGFYPAIALGGLIWSLWHLPITLIGHNYPGMPRPFAVAMFIPACVAMNFLFGAITERAGGSPIASAFAHATVNSTTALVLLVLSTSQTVAHLNWYIDFVTGLTGMVLFTIAGLLVMPRSARASFGPHPTVPELPAHVEPHRPEASVADAGTTGTAPQWAREHPRDAARPPAA